MNAPVQHKGNNRAKYGCFISYCHGQYDLTRRFVEQLVSALQSSLEPYFDSGNCVFIDKDRLQPGYKFNEALGEAVCKSICMIVVCCPSIGGTPTASGNTRQ